MTDILTSLEEVKFDKWREMHIEYAESIGDVRKSFRIEAYLTHDELIKLCHELMEVER